MIQSFKHRGIKRLYEKDESKGLNPKDVAKIKRILARLDAADKAKNMDLPGFHLHTLRGDLAGFWSVTVRANWRIIFRFEEGHAYDVNLLDYH